MLSVRGGAPLSAATSSTWVSLSIDNIQNCNCLMHPSVEIDSSYAIDMIVKSSNDVDEMLGSAHTKEKLRTKNLCILPSMSLHSNIPKVIKHGKGRMKLYEEYNQLFAVSKSCRMSILQ